ncbi:ImmA/IrrE family metallo-endopeptidase [Paenibacillus roseus]|uniref:ImmA/IrrE family metallo-endopeptidase n=1 Tax=Paenibacillus sp. GCM10012307 TaxID=3317343 RepID=UPI0036D355F6
MHYDQLLDFTNSLGVVVVEKRFKSNAQGFCKGNKIGINKDMLTVQKACILAEEVAHFILTVGNILDQTIINNRKQELLARQWAYQCLVPLDHIIKAHKLGISGRYDLADFLEVTEEFLQASIDRYTSKYGLFLKVDERYTIHFDPLRVIEVL